MPSKTTSPEAAQRKVWKAEIRDHEKAASKVVRDFNAEELRLKREVSKTSKSHQTAMAKMLKFRGVRAKKEFRAVAAIERRIAILKGRMGI